MTEQLSHLEEQLPLAPPSSEGMLQPEIVGSPAENLRTAETILATVEAVPGNDSTGERIAEITGAVSASGQGRPEELVVLGDAEALSVLAGTDPTAKAAESLATLSELPEVIEDLLDVDPSQEAATFVAGKIDEALGDYELEFPSCPDAISSTAQLLQKTWRPAGGGLRLEKLEYQVDNPNTLLSAIQELSTPSPHERIAVSNASIRYLRGSGMSLYAPVDAGSVGAEAYDKTQRDRRFFTKSETGGAGTAESYASLLFTGASNPELQRFVADQLDGKTVVNLGGGNARLAQELRDNFAVHVDITNVEPYPSEASLNSLDADPLSVSNPAEPDFLEQSGIEPHSVDEVLAVFSVPAYLGTAAEVTTLFKNIKTILKPGGHARISHLGIVGAQEGDMRPEAILSVLELAAAQGYLVEIVRTNANTLILTAPTETDTSLDKSV